MDAAVANIDQHAADQHVDASPQLGASHGDTAGNNQSHDAVAPHGQTDQTLNVVLISNATPNVDAVVKDVAGNAQIIIFDSATETLSNAVTQLDHLTQSTGEKIGALAIIDHGSAGEFNVGQDHITASNFWAYEASFKSLGSDLASGAQVQIYSCDTAQNDSGKILANEIAHLTGATVFASVNDTGGQGLDWILEYSTNSQNLIKPVLDANSLSAVSTDLGGQPGEPTGVWFQGSGAFAGWNIYNDTHDVYYTKDNTHYWDHKDADGSWTYYNTKAWVGTDKLGDGPYDGGYGPILQWFHVDSGTYAGDVYIADGATYYSSDCTASGATFWDHSGDGTWSYYDSSKWVPTSGFHVKPMNVWYDGYDADAGWDVYNDSNTGDSYFTHDNTHYWDHTGADAWTYYNTKAWVGTDNLGDGPYDGGYGPILQWFHVNAGEYAGDVYIADGATYYSSDHTASGATFWSHSGDGTWSYYDSSKWVPTTGYDVEPTDVWFHGYGTNAGWDVYNDSNTGDSYFTHDNAHYWDHTGADTWTYYNTKAWVGTDNLGDGPYDGGYGPILQWFHVNTGAYAGDVYIADGATYYSSDHNATGATFWDHSSDGTWSYYDASKWVPTTGYDVEPTNVWFHGYGSDTGWDVYNDTKSVVSYFTKDYTHYWSEVGSGDVQPVMVADINAEWVQGSANYLAKMGDALYFQGYDSIHGYQLWKSDGTTTGTFMVTDINETGGSFYPQGFTNVNGTLYFTGYDGVHGWQLWKSDGTTTGTIMVTDINLSGEGLVPSEMTDVNGVLYFVPHDGVHGYDQIWKSDGTAAGTVMIADINPSPTGAAYIMNLTYVNGILYFSGNDAVHGSQLWKSDGTAEGTALVSNISPAYGAFTFDSLTSFNGTIYFFGRHSGQGEQLWESDGTAAGTVLVADVGGYGVWSLVNVNNTLYFDAYDNHGWQLWKSDGTSKGTLMVTDINEGNMGLNPSDLTNVNGTLYFEATDGIHGYQLWKSDGTATGTVMVTDINPSAGGFSPGGFVNFNDTLYFGGNDVVHGAQLWKSDGTAAGTVMVSDMNAGWTQDSSPSYLTNVNGATYFAAMSGADGWQLWKSNGTAAGTVMLTDVNPSEWGGLDPRNLTDVNGTLYFTANDGIHGDQLWKNDGTAAGTVMVTDINETGGGLHAHNLTNVNGALYFDADDGIHGDQLWKSDGTASGTVAVTDFHSEEGSSTMKAGSFALEAGSLTLNSLTNFNGTIYFFARDSSLGEQLWKSDGTTAGTVLVADVGWGLVYSLADVNSTLYFGAYDETHGRQLWKSDGTSTGTLMVTDINEGAGGLDPRYLANVNGMLYFEATDGAHGYQLWKSDGTASGTVMVSDINPTGTTGFQNGFDPEFLTNINGALYFEANDGAHLYQLWKSDGTASGTVMVSDINSTGTPNSPYGFQPEGLTDVNGVLYFSASDGVHGYELWKLPTSVWSYYDGSNWGPVSGRGMTI